MENREKVVADYFELRVRLNRANHKANEKTEVDFRIMRHGSRVSLLAGIKRKSNAPSLELCNRDELGRWKSSSYTGLIHLEDFFANSLNRRTSAKTNIESLVDAVEQIQHELRSLGIFRI